ncbi:YncE family protein [Corallococcus sp. CA054B]|uniref:YncE family protein n=1 Tax=Corallococcus sp. CA054B TaxID=2316734 RepID=UPI000EA0105D|nr:YncE family protein [Corallococcus sp. CA054B]RKG70860.1 YncE family protein [Corallococcus sp. CA054B]
MRPTLKDWHVFPTVLGTLPLAVSASAAEPTPKRALLIVSKTRHALAIVEPVSLKVLGRVPVGEDPHEVVTSADGKTAYVSNTGFGRFHELNVIDLVAQKALPNVDTSPLMGMGTGQNRTHMLHVTADEKTLYTTNVDSGTVSILENVLLQPTVPPTGVLPPTAKPQMDWVQTLVPVAEHSEGFDVSPDGKELWSASPTGALSVVDLKAKKGVATVDAKLPGAHRLEFTPDGKRVLAVSVRTGELAVFDTGTRKEVKRLKIGRGAAMLMDAEGNRAFVSCTPDNDVAVIDLKTLEVTGHIDVGGRPDGLAFAVRR